MLVKLIPGDPAVMMLGPFATEEQLARLHADMGLDGTLVDQFWIYLQNLVQGDLGTSWQTTRPVVDDLFVRFPATIELITLSLLLALLIGIPLGVAAAYFRRSVVKKFSDYYGLLAGSLPDFWFGLVLIYFFYTLLQWTAPPLGRLDIAVLAPPAYTNFYIIDSIIDGNWQALKSAFGHLILPVITLGVINAGPILKMTQATMERMLESDFIRYADMCGLPKSVVIRQAFRNSLPSIVTIVSVLYGFLIGGAVLRRDRVQLGRGRAIRRAGRVERGYQPGARLRAVLGHPLTDHLSDRGPDLFRDRSAHPGLTPSVNPKKRPTQHVKRRTRRVSRSSRCGGSMCPTRSMRRGRYARCAISTLRSRPAKSSAWSASPAPARPRSRARSWALLVQPGRIDSGGINFDRQDLRALSEEALRAVRGRDIAMVIPNPRSELDPLVTVGKQIANVARAHLKISRKEADEMALAMLEAVHIPDPKRRFKAYPHELSGGMAQRVVMAISLVCSPKFIISDDATSGLDVTVQAQVLDLLRALVS